MAPRLLRHAVLRSAALVVVLPFLCPGSPSGWAQARPGPVTIPVKFNVLPGTVIRHEGALVPFDEARAKETIDAANGFLAGASASYRLSFHALCTTIPLGDNDDTIDPDEFNPTVQSGMPELRNPPLNGKGFKVWIGTYCYKPDAATATLIYGAPAYHPGPPPDGGEEGSAVPVINLGTSGNDTPPLTPTEVSTVSELANTLVHETIHSLTCTYDIDGDSGPIDGEGHSSDPCHLSHSNRAARMTSKPSGRGAGITPRQRQKIDPQAAKIGNPESVVSPPSDPRHALWLDEPDDAAPDAIDLFLGAVDVASQSADAVATTYLHGAFPTAGSATYEFRYAFDTDDDSQTGTTVGTLAGADVVVAATLDGAFPFTGGAGSISSFAIHPGTSGSNVVTNAGTAYVAHAKTVACGEGMPGSYDVPSPGDLLVHTFPLSWLGSHAPRVRFVAHGSVLVGGLPTASDFSDVGELVFTTPPRPRLTLTPTFGAPSEALLVLGAGFEPLATVDLSIESQFVSAVTADAAGAFSASITIPALAESDHFLYATQSVSSPSFVILHVYDARKGSVNTWPSAYDPSSATDVLFVNGSSGAATDRTVTVGHTAPFTLAIQAPPGMADAGFALYTWAGGATNTAHRTVLPNAFGLTCKPTPLTPALGPQPAKIANNTGLAEFGVENWPGPPTAHAPTTLLNLGAGLQKTGIFYFQGVIADVHSLNGYSVTNGITVISQ